MSYNAAEKLMEDLRLRSQISTRPRSAMAEDRQGTVAALRSLSQQAGELATQIERGQLSESTVVEVFDHVDMATRVLGEAVRRALSASRR